MFFRGIKGLIAVSAFLLTVNSIHAEVVPEVTFSGGYTDNLFNDSSSINDGYTAISPVFKIYPSATTELSLGGAYTLYYGDTNSDLSNLFGTAALTIIPNFDDSSFNLMLSAGVSARDYGPLFEVYNHWGFDARAVFSYYLAKRVIWRGGASAEINSYTKSISGDNDALSFFSGLNLTPFGSNSFNFEAGYSLQRYVTEFQVMQDGHGPRTTSSLEGVKNRFHVAHFSARYSRPLGMRTGLSAFYSQRQFVKEADSVVYGFTIDYLSPWTSMWDGASLGLNIKHFPGLNLIVETGFAYTNKEYISNLDLVIEADPVVPDSTIEYYVLNQREDERTAVYFQIQRPVSLRSGVMLNPSVKLQWIDNSSTDPRYDYAYPDVQAGITVRF